MRNYYQEKLSRIVPGWQEQRRILRSQFPRCPRCLGSGSCWQNSSGADLSLHRTGQHTSTNKSHSGLRTNLGLRRTNGNCPKRQEQRHSAQATATEQLTWSCSSSTARHGPLAERSRMAQLRKPTSKRLQRTGSNSDIGEPRRGVSSRKKHSVSSGQSHNHNRRPH